MQKYSLQLVAHWHQGYSKTPEAFKQGWCSSKITIHTYFKFELIQNQFFAKETINYSIYIRTSCDISDNLSHCSWKEYSNELVVNNEDSDDDENYNSNPLIAHLIYDP